MKTLNWPQLYCQCSLVHFYQGTLQFLKCCWTWRYFFQLFGWHKIIFLSQDKVGSAPNLHLWLPFFEFNPNITKILETRLCPKAMSSVSVYWNQEHYSSQWISYPFVSFFCGCENRNYHYTITTNEHHTITELDCHNRWIYNPFFKELILSMYWESFNLFLEKKRKKERLRLIFETSMLKSVKLLDI